MQARILKISPEDPEEDKISLAAQVLRDGGLVIIPTETVYGVAADMRSIEAITQLYRIKQRPKDKPFSLHIACKERVEDLAAGLNQTAFKLIDNFWPGPLTLILPAKNSDKTVGLRMPDNNIALKLIAMVDAPLVCPSANLSGKPAPVDFSEAIKDLGEEVDLAIDGGKAMLGIESTIVDLTQSPYRIQRQGAIKADQIQRVADRKNVLFICTGNSCRSVMAKAYLEKVLSQAGRRDIEVLSAGIMAASNLGVSIETRRVLEKEGIDVGNHRSRQVTSLMLKKSDVIIVMERMHEQKILELAPEAKTRLFLLKEFVNTNDNSLDIVDPIGHSAGFHEQTFSLIKQGIDHMVKIL
ncbi:MAG: L-threonylcarbamoyladenylate synthase [Candidatus Omnitrophota bacterium]